MYATKQQKSPKLNSCANFEQRYEINSTFPRIKVHTGLIRLTQQSSQFTNLEDVLVARSAKFFFTLVTSLAHLCTCIAQL